MRPSTVGRLRSLGFALIPTFDRPHFDIVLPDLSDATLDRLELWLTDLTCHEARYVWRHHPGWRDELPGNVARAGGAVSIANPAVVSRFNAAHGTHATRYCKVWTRQRELATS